MRGEIESTKVREGHFGLRLFRNLDLERTEEIVSASV